MARLTPHRTGDTTEERARYDNTVATEGTSAVDQATCALTGTYDLIGSMSPASLIEQITDLDFETDVYIDPVVEGLSERCGVDAAVADSVRSDLLGAGSSPSARPMIVKTKTRLGSFAGGKGSIGRSIGWPHRCPVLRGGAFAVNKAD